MDYEIGMLNATFVFIFIATIIFVFYLYFLSRKRTIAVPTAGSVWSFWHIHTTPTFRKETSASRLLSFHATLSEASSEGSLRKMRLTLENTSAEPLTLFLDVSPSLGCDVFLPERRIVMSGRGSAEIFFEVKIHEGQQSITAQITSDDGEPLFSQTHTFLPAPPLSAQGYLDILGLKEGATKLEIKRRRRQLAKKFHPDKETKRKEREQMLEKMKEINRAYTALKELGYV